MKLPPHSKLTQPSVHLYAGKPYKPSWQHAPQTTVVPYLNGHRGRVGAHRDQISRNTHESDA
jgi:hypothetical protein